MKSRKLKMAVVLSALCVASSSLPVFAASSTNIDHLIGTTVDVEGSDGDKLLDSSKLSEVEERTGSIKITLTDGKEGTSKEGVEISCLKVADVVNGEYVIDEAYDNLGVNLNDIKNASELEAAATKIANVAGNGTLLTTDMNGMATFDDLGVGVYLITATNDQNYDDVTPFLIGIPTWSDKEGDMVYDLEVSPKHTPKPEKCKTPKSCPQTNLDSPILWYFGGAAVVLCGLVAVNVAWRKKKDEQ